MLSLLWIFGLIAFGLCELSGDHVCDAIEEHPVNVTEFIFKNITVRNYKWCMGFPPRCSFYTFQTVRIPKAVETFEKRNVKSCCPGYVANEKGDGCVLCRKCLQGVCRHGGVCVCNSGFRGVDCGRPCDPTRWGADCKFECICEHGNCDPRTGRCDCPSGWFGKRCELHCLEGFYGKHCANRCDCEERDLCDPVTGDCIKKTTPERQSTRAIHHIGEILNISRVIGGGRGKSTPTLTKYFDFDRTTSGNAAKIEENSVESTTEASAELSKNSENFPLLNQDGSLENVQPETKRNDKPDYPPASISPPLIETEEDALQNLENPNVLTSKATTVPTATLFESVTLQNVILDDDDPTTPNTTFPNDKENYISDEISKEYSTDTSNLTANIGVAAVATFVVLVAISGMVLLRLYTRRKRKSERRRGASYGGTTFSVYTHSIFHTPLPEPPPVMENPVFAAPTTTTIETGPETTGGLFQTRVVCSMNFPKGQQNVETKEYTYDHPPSTGSYRAASIPEPPDPIFEPVYDEIPPPSANGRRELSSPPPPYKSTLIYANACGKTKF